MISQPMQNPPPPPPPPSMPPQAMTPPPIGYARQPTYAGFWIRLVARFVDGVIVSVPLIVLFAIFGGVAAIIGSGASSSDQSTQNAVAVGFSGIFILFYLVALVVVIGYQVYFWGTSGSTLGMRLFHLRVVDADTGGPIGIPRAIVRWLMTIVNSWACYIGWIWVAFDPRKQGWHDKVANSVVLQS
jgi:uncharacterized RDD family membrane protein YckC